MFLRDDRKLLDAFRRGERTAMRTVYEHYAPGLGRLLRAGFAVRDATRQFRFHGLRSPVDVEDLLQEIFLRAFSEGARLAYDGLRPFRGYLYAIARNVAIDKLVRAAGAKVTWVEDDAGDSDGPSVFNGEAIGRWEAEGSPQEASVEERELARLIAEVARGLAPVEVEVMRLRLAEGLEQLEVARLLGLSEYKVRKLERRVRSRMRVTLRRRREGEVG